MRVMQELHNFGESTRWQHSNSVAHDTTIPQWFVAILKKQLVDVGINPQAVNIDHSDESDVMVHRIVNEYSIAENEGARVINGCFTDKIQISVCNKGPGTICINLKNLAVRNIDANEGKAMIAAYMIKIHDDFDILRILRNHGVSIKQNDISAFNTLRWRQASLRAALKNQLSAHCIRSYWNSFFSSSVSSVEYYNQLRYIDYCWKALEWLKKYYSTNYHCIPLLLKAEEGDAVAAVDLVRNGMVVTQKIINGINKPKDRSFKGLLQKTYKEQSCCICLEHPKDIRNMPCDFKHIKNFICRDCYYNKLAEDELNQKICPLCQSVCLPYNKVTM